MHTVYGYAKLCNLARKPRGMVGVVCPFRRYIGYSSCFRKEAGSHGRDTLGIFRSGRQGPMPCCSRVRIAMVWGCQEAAADPALPHWLCMAGAALMLWPVTRGYLRTMAAGFINLRRLSSSALHPPMMKTVGRCWRRCWVMQRSSIRP
jgi:hypothetical protein